jgi:serine/threonine protein kinase
LWDRIQRFRERPEGGAFPLPDALRIARQLASALAAVHQEGIVHRDLKHENVFLVSDPDTPSGERAKILDFGIAKDAAAQGRRTTAGVVIGTPGYMSPEQCAGSSQITDRADVYSLGVMLFEMLTGQPPFEADSVAALMARHITKAPPPLPASVPAAVAALTREMLAKEPGQRPSMQQIQERIDGLSPLGSGHAVLGGLRHEATLLHRAKPFLLAACGLSAAIGLGVTLWLQTAHQRSLPPPPAKPVQSAPPEPPKQQTPAPPEPDESGPVASAAPTSGSEDKPAKRDKPGKAGKSNKMPAGLWGDRKRKPAGSH